MIEWLKNLPATCLAFVGLALLAAIVWLAGRLAGEWLGDGFDDMNDPLG